MRLLLRLFQLGLLSWSVADSKSQCKGGAVAACKCLRNCAVFGNAPDRCEDDYVKPEELVDHTVEQAVRESDAICPGMKCVVMCAQKLECYSADLRKKCASVKTNMPDCDVKCNRAHHRVGVHFMIFAFLFFPGILNYVDV